MEVNKEYLSNQSVINPENQEYTISETTASETERANGVVYFSDLDAKQKEEILQQFVFNQNPSVPEEETENEYIIRNSSYTPYTTTPQQSKTETDIKTYLAFLLDIEPEVLEFIDLENTEEVRKIIFEFSKNYFYPSKEVAMFAEYVRNGGNLNSFIAELAPINLEQLSDEEVISAFYKNRMDEQALQEYITLLKNTNHLTKKANEIRKEIGIIELTPQEIVEKQKELQEQQQQIIDNYKRTIRAIIGDLKLKFKNNYEKEQFIEYLTEIKPFYNENNEIEFVGNYYSYILNFDPTALVLSAYMLYNYEDTQKEIESNSKIIDNIKKNLILSRNLNMKSIG